MASIDSIKTALLSLSNIANSNSRQHIQNIQIICSSNGPFSPGAAMLTYAPSVPMQTSFLQLTESIDCTPRFCKDALTTSKKSCAFIV